MLRDTFVFQKGDDMYEIWEGKDGRTSRASAPCGSGKDAGSGQLGEDRAADGRSQWLGGPLAIGSAIEDLLRARTRAAAEGSRGDTVDPGHGEAGSDGVVGFEPCARTVHLAVYEHRYGLDISAHDTHASAHAALVDLARGQCARDPAIREAVCARYGTWPAGDMTEAELERLLGEWSDIAPSEALWIAECAIESEALRARRRAFMSPPE